MATHSSSLAWKIPRTEGPGGETSVLSLQIGFWWQKWVMSFVLLQIMFYIKSIIEKCPVIRERTSYFGIV